MADVGVEGIRTNFQTANAREL